MGTASMASPMTPPSSKSHAMSSASNRSLFKRLWWLQSSLLATWIFACAKTGVNAVMRLEVEHRSQFLSDVFTGYNPMFMVAFALWLWGWNLLLFQNSRVSYVKVFDLEPSAHLTHNDVWKIATSVAVAVFTSTTLYMYFYSYGELGLAAAQPVLLYCAVPLLLALPLHMLYAPTRFFFLKKILRLVFPLQPVTFADFFVADVLTSMSKVLSDMERAICEMYYYFEPLTPSEEEVSICGSSSLWIPCIVAFPYACRLFQCLRQHYDTKDKLCLFNALKYATAFPVIFVSALKYHMAYDLWFSRFRVLWLLLSLVNTSYSFYWDVVWDWDFGICSEISKTKNMSFHRTSLRGTPIYYWAIGSNLILRCAWTHKLSVHLRDYRMTAFIFSGLEIIRRFQWSYFRVLNESNKMTARPSSISPSTAADSSEDTLLSFVVTSK